MFDLVMRLPPTGSRVPTGGPCRREGCRRGCASPRRAGRSSSARRLGPGCSGGFLDSVGLRLENEMIKIDKRSRDF